MAVKTKAVYKNIPVRPDVYDRVDMHAGVNGRTLGGQVKVWAEQCPHQKAKLSYLGFKMVTLSLQAEIVNVRLYQCMDCGELLAVPDPVEIAEPVQAEVIVGA